MTTHPPLSIVLATTQPWPAVRASLARLRPQAAAVGAELIVVDGAVSREAGLPTSERHGLRWLSHPGASVFALRAAGVAAAQGAIVAFTEDHCLPRADWCARTLALHTVHPSAAAIGGAVENGSTARLIDCANFGLTFGPFIPPFAVRPIGRAPVVANVSYKRRVLPNTTPPAGWLELSLNAQLLAADRIVFDDSVVVTHVQSHGALGTFAAHFHNGRATTGLGAATLDGPARRRHLRGSLAQLPVLLRETMAALRARNALAGRHLACVPLLAGLVLCHGAGQIVGLVAGPGASPSRLH